MAITSSSDLAVAEEQVELHLMGALEEVVHPVGILALGKAGLPILFAEGAIQREQIHALIGGGGEPGKVVHALHGNTNVLTRYILDIAHIFQHGSQQLLGAEHFMAAAERLDLREHIVKGGHAQGHGVGVVNDPRLGRIRLDGLRNLHKHGDGTHCTHQSTRTHRIAYGLIHTHTLRGVHVALHFLEGARQDGNHHKVNAR